MTRRLAFVGAGMMGEALARGLLDAGWSPDEMILADIVPERLAQVGKALGVATTTIRPKRRSMRPAAAAVKPQDAAAGLESTAVRRRRRLVSIVAAQDATIEEQSAKCVVVRPCPTRRRVGSRSYGLTAGRYATAKEGSGRDIFVRSVPWFGLDEDKLDAVTLCPIGSSYIFLAPRRGGSRRCSRTSPGRAER